MEVDTFGLDEMDRKLLLMIIQQHQGGPVGLNHMSAALQEEKDRYQDLVIPFDKIVAIGKSYLAIGEFERGLMVFRATAEASFLKEINVAGTLDHGCRARHRGCK